MLAHHGVPAPPPSLRRHESVPVAYWMHDRFAAVLHIRAVDDEESLNVVAEMDADCFRLDGGRWLECGGGGGEWRGGLTLAPLPLPKTAAYIDGWYLTANIDGGCIVGMGVVGSDVAQIELLQYHVVIRKPIDSPVRAFVVCANSSRSFVIRALGKSGDCFATMHSPPITHRPNMPDEFA